MIRSLVGFGLGGREIGLGAAVAIDQGNLVIRLGLRHVDGVLLIGLGVGHAAVHVGLHPGVAAGVLEAHVGLIVGLLVGPGGGSAKRNGNHCVCGAGFIFQILRASSHSREALTSIRQCPAKASKFQHRHVRHRVVLHLFHANASF